MPDQLRGVLIDPTDQTVKEVFVDPYPAWKTLLGCDDINAVNIARNEDTGAMETIWVDGEGLLHHPEGPFFMFDIYPQPLQGKGLVLGTDQAGETISSVLPVNVIAQHVSFPNVRFTHFTYPEPAERDTPFGKAIVHEQVAHFEDKGEHE